MDAQAILVDENVLKQLVKDIGLDNTRMFMGSLDNEYQKRISNIRQAIEEKSFTGLSAEAHALKSSAQVSGANQLADALIKLEIESKKESEGVFELAQHALTLADLTRFAYLDVKLTD